MMFAETMWLLLILLTANVSAKNVVLSPIGVLLCHIKCKHLGMCGETRYVYSTLQCIITPLSIYTRGTSTIWPCERKCEKESQCIRTRTKNPLCISKIVKMKRNADRIHLSSAVTAATKASTNPGTNVVGGSSRKPSKTSFSKVARKYSTLVVREKEVEKTPSSREKAELQASSATSISSKSDSPQNLTAVDGLITVSKTINLFILSTKVWYPTLTIHGRVTAVRSRGNHVYWCQRSKSLCGRLYVIPETRNYTVHQVSVSGQDLAVDEARDTVVVMRYTTLLSVYTTRWVSKDTIQLDKRPSRIAVNPATRALYVILYHDEKVIAFDYKGNRLFTFSLGHVSRCVDIDPTGDILYSSGSYGNMKVVTGLLTTAPISKDVHIGRLTSTTRVLAYRSKLLIVTDRTIRTYNKRGERLTAKRSYRIDRRWCDRSSPIVTFMGLKQAKKSDIVQCLESPTKSIQKILVVSKQSTRLGRQTNITSTDISYRKKSVIRIIHGELVHLHVSKSRMYHCQRHPYGLFEAKRKEGVYRDEIRIIRVTCYNIAVDHTLNIIFYTCAEGLKKHDMLGRRRGRTLKGALTGKLSENVISLDTRRQYIYLSTKGMTSIRRLTYDGRFLTSLQTEEPIRQLEMSPSESLLYYTSDDNRMLLKSAHLPEPETSGIIRTDRSISGNIIHSFVIMSDKIVVVFRSPKGEEIINEHRGYIHPWAPRDQWTTKMVIFCRSTLQELTTLAIDEDTQKTTASMFVYGLEYSDATE